ncbi:MAG: hypothetical protein A2126_01555 [Candidatus Woykebacteria bacterium GWB1_45_5]|uniref:DUF3048 domain-containing protein n=2 Tax=Candidatus Woykeibacteriota TaxID=1817899 RepID=A0A1G1W2N6_9BACT|nr:MAG: hypothetical protein A2113_00795 [Candidatus Woykebacteria bacterium GWA1_44_8]OGY22657.1 MAG: hypothetical protein A2126_01555 [Candidatus Woykebacteria bacterium GWB1_45_5]
MFSLKGRVIYWKILVGIFVLVLIGVWGVVGVSLGKKSTQAQEAKSPFGTLITENVPEIADYPNPINGTLYTKREASAWKDKVPLAIMVENSVVTRPQSGLSKADIVYEALAEGGITRFAAVFLSQSSQVGPVRSARKYYYDWILEYKPVFAHWGGNEGVRAAARQVFGAKDFDQFAIGGAAFYKTCYGEHCGYTHTDKLWAVADQKGVNKPVSIESWQFKDDAAAKQPNASEVTIGFQGDRGYIVVWRYDPASNSYLRLNGGAAHTDKETGQQIRVKSVIVNSLQSLGYEIVTGVANRNFKTIGENNVKIFQDGGVIEGVWKKSSQEARTHFFDSSGKEVALNRGQIWMEMVPAGSAVSFK